ncbi:MAG: hypothetical protein ACJ786_32360, partial [Catenulispora sp.]
AAGFRLAPIPHAETIPWLTGSTEATWQKTPPYLEVLLAAEHIARSPSLFAAAPAPDRGLLSKQSSLSGRTAPGK